MTATMIATTAICLEVACDHQECADLAIPLLRQLERGYETCATMPLLPVDVWRDSHRTARKRADRAERRGYWFRSVERQFRVDEIHEINVSMPERQGRPMSSSYQQRPELLPLPEYPCWRHAVRMYGVESSSGMLVAYMTVYRCGQLALVSQILGHANHLDAGVMYLLFQGALDAESEDLDGYVVYNRWDSGTDGLRFYKERVGLSETEVEWQP